MKTIAQSVGRRATNHPADVKIIQTLLNSQRISNFNEKLAVDGVAGQKTIRKIEAFQKDILKFSRPDGRVDPRGRTFSSLTRSSPPPSQQMLNGNLRFSEKGANLLKKLESVSLVPYDDQTGKPISEWVKGATIGYGHLIESKQWDTYKAGITEEKALSLLQEDLQPYTQTVTSTIKVQLSQHQLDALVIFTFNIGKGGFAQSSVAKLVNDPTVHTAYPNLQSAWMAWTKSQGKEMKGLVNRRVTEWNLYNHGVY